MNYYFQKTIEKDFEYINSKIRNNLLKNGFGVLTEINIQKAFKEKLGVDFKKFIILGTCNPVLAHQAVSKEPEVGVMMPCNVVLWENKDKSVTVSAIDAVKMLSICLNDLNDIGEKANILLKSSIDEL
ncbi:MAG: hypothetical protein CMF98_02475 [Candidatus Marinimicrobia bacterium]|nr:hypothetical protein [Candidatus Neomarinimicrobiota bacterium]OUW50855.1 MAG: hypothetical protein CBD50_01070 [bacterium TMED190]|tara:strand:- start:1290 stop:1673 length:384 start_codon:yes stop_codon:yes gene_type:complete